MKALISLAIVAILAIPSVAPAFRTFRDSDGNLVGTETRVGNHRTEIRGRDNQLLYETHRRGSRTIIRDGRNNYIGEIDRQ